MSRAIRFHAFGGPEVLRVEDVPEPHAARGEVRVRVSAAGLNPVDYKVFGGQAAEAFGAAPGMGVGNDFAGVIDEVGEGVAGLEVGTRVFGGKRHEALADYVIAEPGVTTLLPTPDGLSDEVASTLTIAARTAAAAINQLHLSKGDTVLIGGAAGGVGVIATQLALLTGARVIGTASEANHEFLRGLGAEPVSYGPGLATRVAAIRRPTAAADLNGSETIAAAKSLKVPGRRITAIAARGKDAKDAIVTGGRDAQAGDLKAIAALVAAGTIEVPIAATYPLEEAGEAYARLAEGHVRGKIVVTTGGSR